MRFPIPLFCIMLAMMPLARSQTSFSITGRTYDVDTNAPLSGIEIAVVQVPVPGTSPSPSALISSRIDGTFAAVVAPGKYVLCIDGSRQYLNPCQWFPGTTTLDTSKSLTVNLALKRGVLLVVRLHDPGGFGATARAAKPGLAKIVGPPFSVIIIPDSGAAQLLPFSKSVGDISEFSLLVPPGTGYTVQATSPVLLLGDASGNPLTQNAYQAVLTTPNLSSNQPVPGPVWRFSPPPIPSKVIDFVAKGLVSP